MPDQNPHSAAPSILLVEDNAAVRGFLAVCLERAGHIFTAAGNSDEALPLLRDAANSIRLLIADVNMPGISGIELASLVTSQLPQCSVLLMSGQPLPPEAEGRGWMFLPKPVQMHVFIQHVDTMLNAPPLEAGERPRVLIAEDDPEMRVRLCRLLDTQYHVVAALQNGQAVLETAADMRPDIVILDISMPGLSGFSVARILRQRMPSVPVVFVTQHAESPYLDEAFHTGVAGYVLKGNLAAELGPALQQVRRGESYVSSRVRAVPKTR